MRYVIRWCVLCVAIAVAMSSCCSKKECPETYTFYVRFNYFPPHELDTVLSTGYAPGSNFREVTRPTRIDGVEDTVNADGSFTFKPKQGEYLTDKYDWVLIVPATADTYRITDYSYFMYSCNCVFDRVKSLSSCTVDGKEQQVAAVKVYKR